MAALKPTHPFPLGGMQRNDRLQIAVKDFGRKIIIKVNRATDVDVSADRRTITITYDESLSRKPKKQAK